MIDEPEDKDEIDPPEQEQVEAADPEIEAEARKYGWKPKEDFTLAPDGWVDADRFMELPSTLNKVLRDKNRDFERQIKERDERLARIDGTLKTALDGVREQERQQYEARLAQIEAEKRAAVELADTDKYDALARQQAQIKPPVDKQAEPVKTVAPEIADYLEKAKWAADPDAYKFAAAAIDANPEVMALPPMRQVQWVEKRLKEYFPEHFETQEKKPAQSKVDGGGLGMVRSRGRGGDDLPADVRTVGQQFVKEGLFKTLDEYAQSYFAQDAR